MAIGWVEYCKADIQDEIAFGSSRSDSLQRLFIGSQRFGDLVETAAEQFLSHALTAIHKKNLGKAGFRKFKALF